MLGSDWPTITTLLTNRSSMTDVASPSPTKVQFGKNAVRTYSKSSPPSTQPPPSATAPTQAGAASAQSSNDANSGDDPNSRDNSNMNSGGGGANNNGGAAGGTRDGDDPRMQVRM